jgi:hypothetical protein
MPRALPDCRARNTNRALRLPRPVIQNFGTDSAGLDREFALLNNSIGDFSTIYSRTKRAVMGKNIVWRDCCQMQSGTWPRKRSRLIALPDSTSVGRTYPAIFQDLRKAEMTSKLITVVSLTALLAAGCDKKSGSTVRNSKKVRVGYIGLTCEAPVYAAYEKDFFRGGIITGMAVRKDVRRCSQ